MIAFNLGYKDLLGTNYAHPFFVTLLVLDIFANFNTAIFDKGIISLNRI